MQDPFSWEEPLQNKRAKINLHKRESNLYPSTQLTRALAVATTALSLFFGPLKKKNLLFNSFRKKFQTAGCIKNRLNLCTNLTEIVIISGIILGNVPRDLQIKTFLFNSALQIREKFQPTSQNHWENKKGMSQYK